MKGMFFVLVVGLVVAMALPAAAETDHRIGLGVHYWQKLGSIDVSNIKEDGVSWILTYQLRPASLMAFEVDLEILPEDFQGIDEPVYAPQVYAVVGSTIYGAVGVGMFYADGDFADDPFWTLRAGVDFALIPKIYLDINALYRFESWDTFDGHDIDKDTLELGAAVRLEF